nr:DNA-(apurinic or apyrimidinic site) lyase [Ipomoea batatas]
MSSNSIGSTQWLPEVRCWCGEVAPVKMSWSTANPGKRYRACPHYGGNDNCWYFEWIDSDVTERVSRVIRGLLKKLDKKDNEIQRIQAAIEKQNGVVNKMKLEFKLQFFYGFAVGIVVGLLCLKVWVNTCEPTPKLFQLN